MNKTFTAETVRGDGRGRALGFPTANMAIERLSCDEGIWASWCRLPDETDWRKAALHIGPRPTFGDDRVSVELHILDFPDRDLYGQTIEFVPMKRIRGVEEFATETELCEAMEHDCGRVRELLPEQPKF